MPLIGGYHIVDLKFLPLEISDPVLTNGTDDSRTVDTGNYIEEIYYNLINSHAKRVVLSGLNFNGVKYKDYEVLFYDTEDGAECILRNVWNTDKKFYITYYLVIKNDDSLVLRSKYTCYETLPDSKFSTSSTNALQNKVITKKFEELDDTLVSHRKRIEECEKDIITLETTTENLVKETYLAEIFSGDTSCLHLYDLAEGEDITGKFEIQNLRGTVGRHNIDLQIRLTLKEGNQSINIKGMAFDFSKLGSILSDEWLQMWNTWEFTWITGTVAHTRLYMAPEGVANYVSALTYSDRKYLPTGTNIEFLNDNYLTFTESQEEYLTISLRF